MIIVTAPTELRVQPRKQDVVRDSLTTARQARLQSVSHGNQPEGDRARKMGEAGDVQGLGSCPRWRARHEQGFRGWNQGEEYEVKRGVQPGGSGERVRRGDDRR